MGKLILKFFNIFLIILIVVSTYCHIDYRFNNPHLTETQLLLELYPNISIDILLILMFLFTKNAWKT